ncbi:MAG: TolC family protein [Deltaproteobacteria bacterium]|nr:TolC family protein [Deltaproteobacteria bacterium]
MAFFLGLPFTRQSKAEPSATQLSFSKALSLAQSRPISAIIAEKRVIQSLERLNQAKSRFYPQLQASSYQFRRVVNLQSSGIDLATPGFDPLVGPFNSFDARLSLTQSLFNAPALSRLKEARLNKQLSQAKQEQARLDATALVANLFIEAYRAQERLPLIQVLLKQESNRLRLAKTQKSLGLASDLELTQAQVGWENMRSQLIAAKSAALESRLDLAAALGLAQKQAIRFVMEKSIKSKGLPKQTNLDSLVAKHHKIESALLVVEQSKKKKKNPTGRVLSKIKRPS